ncbi:MAG: carboxypeptidase regulatory-like domain-containing protein [Thermoanaerobaculia bacterium]
MKATACRAARLLLIGVVASGAVADLRVRVTAAPGAEHCLSGLVITAQPLDGSALARSEPLGGHEQTTVVVPVKGNARFRVRAHAAECWSETVETGTADADLALRVFKAVYARGTFEADRRQWPANIEGAAFRPVDAGTHALSSAEAGHPLECQFQEPAWQCVIPADTPLDLRLRPKGFAPLYFWDVVAGEDIALESRALKTGASISGWVEAPSGKPLQGARISVSSTAHALAEEGRETARVATARTNRRGFFQIDGLAEGEYRLVSRAEGFSPAVLPVVNLRSTESLVWPRQIVHLPFAELRITLNPPTDHDGKPWYVAAEEVSPLETPPSPPLRHAATTEGTWQARSLRNDMYRVRIEDANQSVLQTLVVDLSKGGTTHVPLTVVRKIVRGVLRIGTDPLMAQIRFASMTGRSVQARTDESGRFEVSFPAAGKWTTTVFPDGPAGARITAGPIVVPDTEDDHSIDVVLGGGRLRGAVIARDGRKEKAAVHVVRDGKLIAQQPTDDDGTFDFIGIDAGDYAVNAEGNTGSARKQDTHVADGETVELTLRLEPYSRVAALILTPSHAPASGALVRISTDRGLSWSDLYAKIDGSFEYYLDGGEPSLAVIVLTHAYPAVIAQLIPSSDATIVLPSRGGILRVAYPSYVAKSDVLAPLKMFFVPPSPKGLYEGAAYLEPGVYAVCEEHAFTSRCRSVTITAGTQTALEKPSGREHTP